MRIGLIRRAALCALHESKDEEAAEMGSQKNE
jgi:hypothetical protein